MKRSEDRSEFEVALDTAEDEARRHRLVALREKLVGDRNRSRDVELRACVESVLYGLGAQSRAGALSWLDRAETQGLAGWPHLYFAESAVASGAGVEALHALHRVPARFFESRDLRWRAVRCLELHAIASLQVGRPDDALAAARAINRELRTEAPDEFLAPPEELVLVLLARELRPVLVALVHGVSLDHMFTPVRAREIRAMLES